MAQISSEKTPRWDFILTTILLFAVMFLRFKMGVAIPDLIFLAFSVFYLFDCIGIIFSKKVNRIAKIIYTAIGIILGTSTFGFEGFAPQQTGFLFNL